ncbi:MAG TPA: hypothetical protein VF857_08050 [Spirochaetota bacterium]
MLLAENGISFKMTIAASILGTLGAKADRHLIFKNSTIINAFKTAGFAAFSP